VEVTDQFWAPRWRSIGHEISQSCPRAQSVVAAGGVASVLAILLAVQPSLLLTSTP